MEIENIGELLEEETLERVFQDLDDLCQRLQDDYNGDATFEQTEEDRLAVYHACDLLEFLLSNKKIELKKDDLK